MIVIALVGGILGLIASWALRRDTQKAQELRRSEGIADERMILLSLPGFSLILLGIALFGLIAPGIGGFLGNFFGIVLALLCAGIALFGLYLSVLGLTHLPIPPWLLPKSER